MAARVWLVVICAPPEACPSTELPAERHPHEGWSQYELIAIRDKRDRGTRA